MRVVSPAVLALFIVSCDDPPTLDLEPIPFVPAPAHAPVIDSVRVDSLTTSGALIKMFVNPGGASTQISVEWTASTNPGRQLLLTLADGTQRTSTEVSVWLTSLDPAKKYELRVTARNDVGQVHSSIYLFTTRTPIPMKPTALSVHAESDTVALLTWTTTPNFETEFIVDRKLDDDAAWTEVGRTDASSSTFRDTGLTPATRYHYTVRACNLSGCSDGQRAEVVTPATIPDPPSPPQPPSPPVEPPTPPVAPPVPPSGLATPTNFSATPGPASITLRWQDNSTDETRFQIQFRGPRGQGYMGVPADATAARHEQLIPGDTLYYRILACNASTCSAPSPEISSWVLGSAPIVSTNAKPGIGPTVYLSGGVNSMSQATTAWAEWDTDPSFASLQKSGIRHVDPASYEVPLGFTVDGLARDTRYYFRIAAQNAAGTSYGASQTLVTRRPAPPMLNLSVTADYAVQIEWTEELETGAEVRDVMRRIDGGYWSSMFYSGPSPAPAEGQPGRDIGFPLDKSYNNDYFAQSCNGFGCSDTTFASIQTQPMPAPTLVKAALVNGRMVLTVRNNAAGRSTIQILRKRSGEEFAPITGTWNSASEFEDPNTFAGVSYTYAAQAAIWRSYHRTSRGTTQYSAHSNQVTVAR